VFAYSSRRADETCRRLQALSRPPRTTFDPWDATTLCAILRNPPYKRTAMFSRTRANPPRAGALDTRALVPAARHRLIHASTTRRCMMAPNWLRSARMGHREISGHEPRANHKGFGFVLPKR
jgi:hypothetical protein